MFYLIHIFQNIQPILADLICAEEIIQLMYVIVVLQVNVTLLLVRTQFRNHCAALLFLPDYFFFSTFWLVSISQYILSLSLSVCLSVSSRVLRHVYPYFIYMYIYTCQFAKQASNLHSTFHAIKKKIILFNNKHAFKDFF